MDHYFTRFARHTALIAGKPVAFVAAVALVLVWGLSGPLFDFSETWQLVINTGTTIITFFMVFVIQNTQNRDTAAIQLKLDELVRATKGAKNAFIDSEDLEIEELQTLQKEFEAMAAKARTKIETRRQHTASARPKTPVKRAAKAKVPRSEAKVAPATRADTKSSA